MNFPKRLELLLSEVLALPKACMTQGDCDVCVKTACQTCRHVSHRHWHPNLNTLNAYRATSKYITLVSTRQGADSAATFEETVGRTSKQ